MSRVGKKPVALPKGVSVNARDGGVEVKGPKGALFHRLSQSESVRVVPGEGSVAFERQGNSKNAKARHGLLRALVQNMVTGVTQGFAKELEIQGVGYRAEAKGRKLSLALGFSHPVDLPVPEGLQVSMRENNIIRIEGADKQAVGEFAARVRMLRPPEPYKGKGVRYVNEHVRRKVGKAAVG